MLDYPVTSNNKVDITNLTHATIDGNGVFDVLMRTVNAHLQKEWTANRLKGTEYSTVYLGALESTMNTSLQFLLAKDKLNAELSILEQQLVNLKVEEINATKQGLLLDKQLDDLVAATALKIQQKANLVDELLTNAQQRSNLATEQARISAQTTQISAQTSQINAETLNVPKQGLLIDAQKETQLQQRLNLADELLTAAQQRANLSSENQAIIAKAANTAQQTANLLAEAANIPRQGAVYDSTRLKADAEKALLIDKLTTEASQRTVLAAQASGYKRDAEQKAAEIMTRAFAAIATTTGMDSAAASGYGISQGNVAAAVSKLITNS